MNPAFQKNFDYPKPFEVLILEHLKESKWA